jgi:glutathione S-transferase
MHLYHRPGSRSERVLWLLEELGAPYELTTLSQAAQADAEHRRRHPLGRVPVLEEEGGPIFESAAICLQVADLYPLAGLIGRVGSHERGGTAAGDGRGAGVRYPEPGRERAEAATERFRAAARAVEDALDGHEYLVADRFGVADVLVGSVLAWADELGLLDDGFPNASAYLRRLQARPAYAY